MSTIRVRHLISALESLEEAAAVIPAKFGGDAEGTPRIYSLSIRNVKDMLNDKQHFDQDDPIIEINSVG